MDESQRLERALAVNLELLAEIDLMRAEKDAARDSPKRVSELERSLARYKRENELLRDELASRR